MFVLFKTLALTVTKTVSAQDKDLSYDNIAEIVKIEKEINELTAELEAELKETVTKMNNVITETFSKLTKAKELLNEFMRISKASDEDFEHDYSELIGEAEQFCEEIN